MKYRAACDISRFKDGDTVCYIVIEITDDINKLVEMDRFYCENKTQLSTKILDLKNKIQEKYNCELLIDM